MKFALIGGAALAAAAFATPVLAQQVIDDPARCAQFYPNANCQNLGPAIRKLMAATIAATCTGTTATKRHLEGRRPYIRPKRESLVGSSSEWQIRSTHKREWFMFTPVEADG